MVVVHSGIRHLEIEENAYREVVLVHSGIRHLEMKKNAS